MKAAVTLGTRKEAEIVAGAVVGALEETLVDNIGRGRLLYQAGELREISISHRLGTYRRIPLTGETKMTSTKRKVRFVALGRLRRLEKLAAPTSPVA